MNMHKRKPIGVLACLALMAVAAHADETLRGLNKIQEDWARVYYQTPRAGQEAGFDRLVARLDSLRAAHENSAEPLVWKAIVLSTQAGVVGGLSGLGKVKEARELLLGAEAIDPYALDGSIYTSLGSLYYKVPGWPLAYGNDEQAEVYLKKALKINSYGIDPNYFYADYLYERGDYHAALYHAERALDAPPRVNRPLADAGRRQEIEQLIMKVNAADTHATAPVRDRSLWN